MSDQKLLEDYVRQGSDEAFAMLVRRHVSFVYSVAFRHVREAADAAEITQAAFILLARKATGLRRGIVLESWLYGTTRLISLSFLRGKQRRQKREHEAYMQSTTQEDPDDSAWKQLAPLLEEAMAWLGEKDRQALILRFFKEKNLGEVAAAMHLTEAAAQSRVHRAVGKLQKFFNKRGVVLTTAVVTGAISANSTQAAPATLANSVTAAALGKGATVSASTLTLTKGALQIMAWTKTTTTVVVGVALILAASTTALVFKRMGRPPARASELNPFSIDATKISPFSSVRFDGDSVIVTYEGTEYQLSAINGVSAADILSYSRNAYRDKWKKHLAEDLVVVLGSMGHPLDTSRPNVSLALMDPQTGQIKNIKDALMTQANRKAVHESLSPDIR